MAKPCIFLDTSIFIAALLSKRGGSFYILTSLHAIVDFKISEYVLALHALTFCQMNTKNSFYTAQNIFQKKTPRFLHLPYEKVIIYLLCLRQLANEGSFIVVYLVLFDTGGTLLVH